MTSRGRREGPSSVQRPHDGLGPAVVDVEVHRVQLVGVEVAGVLDGPGGSHVDPVDQDDGGVTAQHRRFARRRGGSFGQDGVFDAVLGIGAGEPVDRVAA